MAAGKYEALQTDGANILTSDKHFEDLDHDMWSLTVILISKDLTDLTHGTAKLFQKVRLAFGCFAQCLNLSLQMYILFCVHDYVVGPAVHRMQADYKQFHEEVFDPDGTFRKDLWHVWKGPWLALCSSAMTKMVFTGVIIFLWSTQMLGELRNCIRFRRRIQSLPSKPDNVKDTEMVLEKEDENGNEELHIIFLNVFTRFVMYTLVLLPRFCVCVVLWYVGCRWLNATESFGDLILNALALEFITLIDELILTKFFPDRIRQYIDSTKYAYEVKSVTDEEKRAQVLRDYFISSVYALLVIIWTVAYITSLQQVIPGYTHDIDKHCTGDWFTNKFEVQCEAFEKDCFPYGPKDGHPLPPVRVPGGDRLL